jgi:hypothetical protein
MILRIKIQCAKDDETNEELKLNIRHYLRLWRLYEELEVYDDDYYYGYWTKIHYRLEDAPEWIKEKKAVLQVIDEKFDE